MWSKILRTLNPYHAIINNKPRIIDSSPEEVRGSLSFGYAACPKCACRNPIVKRERGIKIQRCLCCSRLFFAKGSNFERAAL